MLKDFIDCSQTNPTPISLEQKAAQKAIAAVQGQFRGATTPEQEWDCAILRALAAIREDIRNEDSDALMKTHGEWKIILREIMGEVRNLAQSDTPKKAIAAVQNEETLEQELDYAIQDAISAIRQDILDRSDEDFNSQAYRGSLDSPLDSTLKDWENILKDVFRQALPNLGWKDKHTAIAKDNGLLSLQEENAQALVNRSVNFMSPEENAQSAFMFVKKYVNFPYPRETTEDRIVAAIMQDLMTNGVIKYNWLDIPEEDFSGLLEGWRIIIRKTLNDPDYAIAQEEAEPAIATSPQKEINLGDYGLASYHLLQTRDGQPITHIALEFYEQDKDNPQSYHVCIGSDEKGFRYRPNGRRLELSDADGADPFDIILRKDAEPAIAGVPKVLKEVFVDEDTGEEQTFVELVQDFRELKSPWAKEETELDIGKVPVSELYCASGAIVEHVHPLNFTEEQKQQHGDFDYLVVVRQPRINELHSFMVPRNGDLSISPITLIEKEAEDWANIWLERITDDFTDNPILRDRLLKKLKEKINDQRPKQ